MPDSVLIKMQLEEKRNNASWCLLFLEHLDEFARLAWYLVADEKLVEYTIMRTIVELDEIPFDGSWPLLAYNQAREILIKQAIITLDLERDESCENEDFKSISSCEPPDLPRLAFMLKLVLRTSENEVAKFLDVTPSEVRQLVQHAINRSNTRMPSSLLTTCYDA